MIGPLLSAVAFLTRIPVPAFVHANEANLRRSARWFPVVGLLLGCICAGAAWGARLGLPSLVVAVLVLIADALLTGALHLDGLADMADGFGGGRTREDVLRIMRDHAIGSYGGTALVLVLVFKAACLPTLVVMPHGLLAICFVPALARWSILLLSTSAPYARRDDGPLGSGSLSQSITRFDLAFGTACCALLPFVFGFKAVFACWAAVAVISLLVKSICVRRIGGMTGDTLGANVAITEAVQYAVAILVLKCAVT